jgi:predicted nucleotidyltransferase
MLNSNEKASVLYHDLFDYPLNLPDLIKWKSGKQLSKAQSLNFTNKRGFYFLEGHEGLIYKKLLRKRISAKKMKIAQKASKILSFLPGVKMVAVTGSLAMENSSEESDIDLMVITKKGTLWTTRLLSYFVLSTMQFVLRRPFDKDQKDKLCLNIWLDESALSWSIKDRNLYTAHEIAQIVPLVNKEKTYEKFLWQNKWILDYWPNSVRIKNLKLRIKNSSPGINIIEKLAFELQYSYMKNKISREVVTPTRAVFHPRDWGKVVLSRLTNVS